MSKAQRDKGSRGQTAAKHLLLDRDWKVISTTAGIKTEDFVATDQFGRQWSVEVKNCSVITNVHRMQAMEQARKRGLPWMLMSKIAGTSSWLIQRQGCLPMVWNEKPVVSDTMKKTGLL